MILQILSLTIALSGAPLAPTPQSADTLEISRQLKRELIFYYDARNDPFLGRMEGREGRCSADDGYECFGGDPDRFHCPPDVMCQPGARLNEILDHLKSASRDYPDAGWVVGYTAYSLMKAGRALEAFEIVEGCAAAEWYCSLLEGYVFQEVGRTAEADTRFRHGLESAPDSITCMLSKASWALGDPDRERLEALPCGERLAASDTVWWLADPLYAFPGNDRWTEHLSRTLSTFLLYGPFYYAKVQWRPNTEVQYFFPGLARVVYERIMRFRIPRGFVDSWTFDRSKWVPGPGWSWTSQKAARYHFVPDFEDGDFSRPTWRLDAALEDEGYTPTSGAFYELPAQIARFRRADSMLVVVAGTLADSPLEEAAEPSAHLILSDGPGSFPVELSSEVHDQRAVFLAQTPPERYVTSFEVLSEAEFGRHRVMLDPLDTEGPGVSDILLYRPMGDYDPDSLLIAAGMMLGETVVERGARPGIYWETYGAEAEELVSVELEVRREGGGLRDWVTRLVPGGAEGHGRLSWTEASPGPWFRNSVVLDLEGLDSGQYSLRLRTWWPGQDPLETERAFEVR